MKRRKFLGLATAAIATPVLNISRAWAAEPGAPLPIPEIMEVGSGEGNALEAIRGTRDFVGGAASETWGYSQDYLGPLLRFQRGRTANISVTNRLDEPITAHWHGMHVPGYLDGGPQLAFGPGETWAPELPIDHPADAALADTRNIEETHFQPIDTDRLLAPARATHAPRILLLYGSLRDSSFSRLMTEEAARILTRLGAETRTYCPSGFPLPDDADADHPKVKELRDLVTWSEGMVWCSPERHGAMTGVMKTQIDWIPLCLGGVRPTQGKTLAVMQVSGGSQSFNAVNQLRILGRWMCLLTIPNQSSTPKAFLEFDEAGRMKPSPLYDRMVDVMEELMKFTLLTRDNVDVLLDRYSERRESAAKLSKRVNQKAI